MPPPSETRPSGPLRTLLIVVSLAELAPLGWFARAMHEREERGLLAVTALALALALLGAFAAWKRRAWTGWPVLGAASWTATAGFWAVSALGEPRAWSAVALGSLGLALGVLTPTPKARRISWSVRLFCVSVAALTRYVAYWGLLFPLGFDAAMPFVPAVPPLHARFIGALYLGATVICVWHVFARRWAVGRLLQTLIFLWTFILLVVSLRHLDAFDWEAPSVWLWFVAYLAFPPASLWILRRIELEPDNDAAPLPAWGRAWLYAQGTGLLLLAGVGTFAVQTLIGVWPWKLGDLLGHIYAAPFAAFGIGSCLAARAHGERRRAVVPFCAATLAMAAGSLAASLQHRDKFVSDAPSTWVWFGVLGAVAVASVALVAHTLVLFRPASTRASSAGSSTGARQP